MGDRHWAHADRADVARVHATIRAKLTQRFGDEGDAMRILYGGSVNASNAESFSP